MSPDDDTNDDLNDEPTRNGTIMTSHLLILGAGTAGTITANKLRKRLDDSWEITVIEASQEHHYQPGYLFIPFGMYDADDVVKPNAPLLGDGISLVLGEIDLVDTDGDAVLLADGRRFHYDQLVIATGTQPRREQTEGLDSDEYGVTVAMTSWS